MSSICDALHRWLGESGMSVFITFVGLHLASWVFSQQQ